MNSPDVGKSVVLRFLRDYIDFGSWGHVYAAKAYLNQIYAISDANEKDLLGVKLYTEFFLSLEDLAALCIAVRNREEDVGFIYSYLTFGTRIKGVVRSSIAIKEMFEVLTKDNPLSSGLNIPMVEDIFSISPDLAKTGFRQFYEELGNLLPNLGKLYLFDGGAFVRAFNKTKHGFVIVKDGNIFHDELPDIKPGNSWIITNNPDYHPVNAKDKPVVERYLNQTRDTKAFFDRIVLIRGAVVAICQIMIELLERNIIKTKDGDA